MRAETDTNHRVIRWPFRVSVWLIALAVVPLIGAGWFAGVQARDVARVQRQSALVASTTEELIEVTKLNARLLDERNWLSATATIAELSLPSGMVDSVLGVEIETLLDETMTEVDRLIVAVGLEELESRIRVARATDGKSLLEVGLEYEDVASVVEDRAERLIDDILVVAGDTDRAAPLIDAIRMLDGAAEASNATTVQLTAFYGAQFGGDTAENQLDALVIARARYDDAVEQMTRLARAESTTKLALDDLTQSSEAMGFRKLVDDLVDTRPTPSSDISAILGAIPTIVESFSAGAGAIEQHLSLVEAAQADVVSAAGAVEDSANLARRNVLLRTAGLGAATILFAFGLARAIGRPLQRMAGRAEMLRKGERADSVRAAGPREVREAIDALNEAAEHIDLAGRQAEALSRGELDNPVLDETAEGMLGLSLQDAVRTLATSLAHRADLSRQLSHEASHDSLTRLANRSASLEFIRASLDAELAPGQVVAVTFVDLDDFKLVNDHHGHPAGDSVLEVVARRLWREAGDNDLVGRIGGDEFVVISYDLETSGELVERAQRMIDVISAPISVNHTSVRVNACVGVAISGRGADETPESLLRDADLAVYKAKRRGRGSIEVCDHDLRAEQMRRTTIEAALREAIDRDTEHEELTLSFQPIIDAKTGKVTMLEALIRWQSPTLGAMAPSEFVTVAERSNLILEIDKLVIRKCVRQLQRWEGHPELDGLAVAINVSAGHILSHTFTNDVLQPVRDGGVDPRCVVLEVTESALLHDLTIAAGKLTELRKEGIRVAIDDFGTGYTSLGQLRSLPVDILKIDRSFVTDESASGLVELIILMGHMLDITVTAEGIETEEEAGRLAALGADQLQGYRFGYPVPVHEVEESWAAASVGGGY